MRSHLQRLKIGFSFLFIHVFFSGFCGLFLPVMLYDRGLPLYSFVLLSSLATLCTLFVIPFYNRFFIHRSLALGYLSHALMYASIAFLPTVAGFGFYALFWATSIIFFWQPLNFIFYQSSGKKTNATDSSLYFLISGVVSIFVPLLAGYVYAQTGYLLIFGVVCILYVVASLFALCKGPKTEIHSVFRNDVMAYARLKTLTCLEGALHFFLAVVIPSYTLLFFSGVSEFGAFTSYSGLVAFIIAVFVAYRSDKSEQRLRHFWLFFVAMALSSLAMIFTKTKLTWVLVVGVFSIFYHLSNPLRLAISMDLKEVNIGFWRVREFFLSLGRFVFMALVVVLFLFEMYTLVFVFGASLSMFYFVLVKRKFPGMK